jgi:hypothetical protein
VKFAASLQPQLQVTAFESEPRVSGSLPLTHDRTEHLDRFEVLAKLFALPPWKEHSAPFHDENSPFMNSHN